MIPSATRIPPWQAEQHQLWSLLVMIEFFGHAWFSTFTLLHDQYNVVKGIGAPTPPATVRIRVGGSGKDLTEQERNYIHYLADCFAKECDSIGMEASSLAARMLDEYATMPAKYDRSMVQAGFDALLSQVSNEMSGQRFAFVPEWAQEYFQNELLFGQDAFGRLAEARLDMMDAGNCLALGLDAAAAFHLIRVAEISIRTFFDAKQHNIPNRPNIEDADWSELISHMDLWLTNEIVRISTPSPARGSPERQLIDAYNALISDARFLKEERNKTMHPRHAWTHPEAEHTLMRVRAFAQRIARMI